ncbi:MAG TPA: DUF692 domain-containing protein [Micromonosporaceae bacterium]
MTAGWPSGVGLGWRPELAGLFDELPGLRFTEVIAESLASSGAPPAPLAALRERGVTVIPHGVRLSLGGAEPLEPARIDFLARCAESLEAPLVSEHIAFVRAGGIEAGHLLPVPRTRDMVDLLVRNIRQVRASLPVPLALEPIAALFDWPDDELDEADFLTEIVDRTDALLLLDVANAYANARNRGDDPTVLLDRLPLERIGYVHVAGGSEHEGLYHDTHTDPTPHEVLDLVRALCGRRPAPGSMLERDGGYPPKAELYAELDAIAAAAGHPRITGTAHP